MQITPDQIVIWQWGVFTLNATIVCTWVVMGVLVVVSWLLTRKIRQDGPLSHGQNVLEAIVWFMQQQIRDVSGRSPSPFLPFVGTLFLFIMASNLLSIVPGYEVPTSSLSTTSALALCVFFAAPVFGIREQGVWGYLRHYAQPSIFMLPLNLIGEVSRTLALALRLFGNMMSGAVMVAILATLAPLFFPIVLQAFGLVIGMIQAYIFSVLATVYIASATQAHDETSIAHRRNGRSHG